MDTPASSASNPSGTPDWEEKIRHLSPEAQAAFRRFQQQHDLAAIDAVIFGILEEYAPKKAAQAFSTLPPETKLIDDLGFDSLAFTEIVFFTEDLFRISISNDEIMKVATIADLRAFVRHKVSATPTAS
ncbi:acyl carrier protein [Opitutus sp. ER46]|uniref:acyl carrier protein n=1 Tax=Opitutus sp. ER46 TaxID=2161864 RepID=UPI000D307A6D|nr:acyl carrier protein [Opitutus sp. ER46]PTY01254.1 hypothetical protein DB354_00135 [Opitutus sp. ER46]